MNHNAMSTPDNHSSQAIGLEAKAIVEEFPSFNEVVKRGLIAHHQGTDNLEFVIVASDFVGELGVWLQTNPAYPCYKAEGSRIDPKEYTLDELAVELGYASRGAGCPFPFRVDSVPVARTSRRHTPGSGGLRGKEAAHELP